MDLCTRNRPSRRTRVYLLLIRSRAGRVIPARVARARMQYHMSHGRTRVNGSVGGSRPGDVFNGNVRRRATTAVNNTDNI